MPRTQPPSTSRQQWHVIYEEGIEPILSTTDVAQIFGKSNQWVYWGLRNAIFVDDDGAPLIPERAGENDRARRIFTPSLVKQMARSCYARGNINLDQLTKIMYRINQTRHGIEWRRAEGWKYVDVGRNRDKKIRPGQPGRLRRYRWVPPHQAVWSKEKNDFVFRGDTIPRKKKSPGQESA